MKILVIAPSWVGDTMISQGMYRTLKVKYPTARIDVMASQWCRSLLKRMPEVNKTLSMPLDHGVLAISERRRLGISLRASQYERAYVLPNSFKSVLVPFFANIPQRIGWRGEMRYGLLNDIRVLDKLAFPMMIQRYITLTYDKKDIRSAADLLQPLLWPQLQVRNEEILEITRLFNITNKRPIIGLCPGAESGLAKRWPHYYYSILAQQLINNGYQVALFGSVKDYFIGEEIRLVINKNNHYNYLNLAGQTSLEQVVVLIAACNAIVSNDSGLMHIAAALNKPLIAIYGPTSPNFTPPLSKKAKVIRLTTNYYKRGKDSIIQGYDQSLINITPEQVMIALNQQLSS
ncbi:ADP-heptose--LPS heptosyltransferase RfaF [Candidatus Fukatsuia anoeciicola]|uniref:ADP-heptose--LPS heptosyltransferase RfaF n=1 Tax=Candidatus Fukatsuia anoeciicola TaxID=2994492 RepID=UPI0034643549